MSSEQELCRRSSAKGSSHNARGLTGRRVGRRRLTACRDDKLRDSSESENVSQHLSRAIRRRKENRMSWGKVERKGKGPTVLVPRNAHLPPSLLRSSALLAHRTPYRLMSSSAIPMQPISSFSSSSSALKPDDSAPIAPDRRYEDEGEEPEGEDQSLIGQYTSPCAGSGSRLTSFSPARTCRRIPKAGSSIRPSSSRDGQVEGRNVLLRLWAHQQCSLRE